MAIKVSYMNNTKGLASNVAKSLILEIKDTYCKKDDLKIIILEEMLSILNDKKTCIDDSNIVTLDEIEEDSRLIIYIRIDEQCGPSKYMTFKELKNYLLKNNIDINKF